jgi:exodeoxyribonuclease III
MAKRYRIASWNVNSVRSREAHIVSWLQAHDVAVLALQETKVTDDVFPREAFEAIGYRVHCFGQKAYNGVAFLVRSDCVLTDVVHNIDGFEDAQARAIAARLGDVYLVNLYVPNGRSVDSEPYHYKLAWLAALRDWLETLSAAHERVVLMGDFNIAPADRDVHDPEAWQGSILVSAPEREALAALEQLGFQDVFRQKHPDEVAYSWWDYRRAAFRRNLGMRIDLFLASSSACDVIDSVGMDIEPRKLPQPSDHIPIWLDLVL